MEKKVPTIDAIQLFTGISIGPNSTQKVIGLCNDMLTTQKPLLPFDATVSQLEIAKQCKEELAERYPVFNTIQRNFKRFISSKKSPEAVAVGLEKWAKRQVTLFGSKEFELPTFAPNWIRAAQETKSLKH